MFPLAHRKHLTYVFGSKTSYANFHLGVDYDANYENVYAPFDGEVIKTIPAKNAPQGGNTIWFKPDHDDVIIRFLHLSKFMKSGRAKEGEVIAVSGNTGLSDYRHLHIDISKHSLQLNNIKNFIDPEKYDWDYKPKPMIQYPVILKVKLVINAHWITTSDKLAEVNQRLFDATAGKLQAEFDITETNFTTIPFVPTGQYVNGINSQEIDHTWYDQNITPLGIGYHIVCFVVGTNLWPAGMVGWREDHDEGPVELEIESDENQMWTIPAMSFFVNNFLHETTHALKQISNVPDDTHNYLLYDKFDLPGALANLNYDLINNFIAKGKEMIVKKASNPNTLYLMAEGKLFGLAVDYPKFQAEFPNVHITTLSDADFNSYPVSRLVLK